MINDYGLSAFKSIWRDSGDLERLRMAQCLAAPDQSTYAEWGDTRCGRGGVLASGGGCRNYCRAFRAFG